MLFRSETASSHPGLAPPAAAKPAAAPARPAPAAAIAAVPDAEPAPATTPVPAEEPESPAAADSVLHLDFGADSWVEIKDASGRMLIRQLNPSGTGADVRGRPPFEVVIGNAAQVRLTYNNRPIDLAPFIDVTVARFTLEE